jgi:hypothetical protein
MKAAKRFPISGLSSGHGSLSFIGYGLAAHYRRAAPKMSETEWAMLGEVLREMPVF